MAFLDLTVGSDDLQLLPASLRKDEDLAALVAECEAVLVAAFTRILRGGYSLATGYAWGPAIVPTGAYLVDAESATYVFLRGYDPDPLVCEARLLAALKLEIAALVRWRRHQWRMNPQTSAESDGDGGKSLSYREDKNALTHPAFGAHLLPFDLRPPAAVI